MCELTGFRIKLQEAGGTKLINSLGRASTVGGNHALFVTTVGTRDRIVAVRYATPYPAIRKERDHQPRRMKPNLGTGYKLVKRPYHSTNMQLNISQMEIILIQNPI